MLGIFHFTVHEADVAVYHAWHDGFPVSGPFDRHLELGLVARFRAGMEISRQPLAENVPAFGDWRQGGKTGDVWTVGFGGAFGAIVDGGIPVASLPPVGTPLLVVVRFLCSETKQWRVFQFHDALLDQPDARESSQNMMVDYRFRATWMEPFEGLGDSTLPSLAPRLAGVLEWVHLGRRIPCWYYDAMAGTWTENPENLFENGEDSARYVRMTTDDGGVTEVGYMAARTAPAVTAGDLAAATVAWSDVTVFTVGPAGLVLYPGWAMQPGAPEPIWLRQSSRHWEHPVVRFRFLGRIYATLGHGVFATPAWRPDTTPHKPLDLPLRLGRLVVLPEAAYLLPAPP